MLYNSLVVFDFETAGGNPADCEVIQVAALAINPRNLTVIPGSHFESMMRALEPDKIQQGALDKNKKTREEIAAAPHPEEVWHRFADWCKTYCRGGKNDGYNSPIPAGHNIVGFDWPILQRYSLKYGTTRTVKKTGAVETSLFNGIYKYDTLLMMAAWTESLPEPSKLSLDYLRKYFDYPVESREKAHDALQDVKDTGVLLTKLLGLHRKIAPTVIWKDCMNPEKVEAEMKRRKDARLRKAEREAQQKARGAGRFARD